MVIYDHLEEEVCHFQWTRVQNQMAKIEIAETVLEPRGTFYKQLSNLARHDYNSTKQHAGMREMKEKLKEGEGILHEDFYGNYAIKQQNEIMSAHRSTTSVTISTAIAYYKVETDSEHRSYSVVSDSTDHVSKTVYALNAAFIRDMTSALPFAITNHHYWCDGAESQFKNHYHYITIRIMISLLIRAFSAQPTEKGQMMALVGKPNVVCGEQL